MYRYNTLIDFFNVLIRDLIRATYLEVVANATCIDIINKIKSFTIVVITISYKCKNVEAHLNIKCD